MIAAGLTGRVRNRTVSLLAIAGIGYSVAWIVGLLIAPGGVDVDSSGSDILDSYAGSRGSGLAQSVLAHGLAGIALAVVVSAIAARHRHPGMVRAAGYGAVALSLAQCVLEFVLFLRAVPNNDAASAHDLYAAVSRLDGVKMLALAALAGIAISGSKRLYARWLVVLGWALAAAITVSGIGYLFLIGGPASAAFVSLPLLLVWVTGTSLTIGKADRLMLRYSNMLLMFLLELAVYVSVAVWAVTLGSGTALHVILAIVAIGAWAGVWAIFGAPRAKKYKLHGTGRVGLEILWFGGAIAVLAVAGHLVLAAVFAGLFLINAAGRAFFDLG